jgi:Ca2+/Na+ antiporter
MPDLSGNVIMARKGLANVAITACFAGPVFNILVGLGCGFGVLRHATGDENTFDSCNQDRVCVLFRQLQSTSGYQVGHQ